MQRTSLIPAIVLLSAAAACGGAAAGNQAAREREREQLEAPPAARPVTAEASARAQDSRRTAIVAASERVAPAVVSVNVVRRERVVPRTLWEEMMLPPGAERETAGLGSGFIITAEGL